MAAVEKLEGGFAFYLTQAEAETLSMIVANCYTHNNKHVMGFSYLLSQLEEQGLIRELDILPQAYFEKIKEHLVVNGESVRKILKGNVALSVPEIKGE